MMQSPLKILHIEDDPFYASMTHLILTEESGLRPYDVVHVDSMKKALNALKKPGFEAVLLDLSLNDMSGLENVRAIKDENPALAIIVLTGQDNEDMAMKALDEGAQDFIVKGYANNKVLRLAIRSSIKRKAAERNLYHQANYDALTGLMNRRHFVSHLQRGIDGAKRRGGHEALLFIDLDHFKQVNTAFGHEAGNAVLKEVAQRMTSRLRASDIVARYGGDEFMVLLDGRSEDPKLASAALVTALQDAFNSPVMWNGQAIDISASIGIAIYPDAGNDAGTMLENADRAMYEAKKHGGRHFRFAVTA